MRLADPCDASAEEAIRPNGVKTSNFRTENEATTVKICPTLALKSSLLVTEEIGPTKSQEDIDQRNRCLAKYSMFIQGAHFEGSLQPLTPARASQSPSIRRTFQPVKSMQPSETWPPLPHAKLSNEIKQELCLKDFEKPTR